MKFPIVAVLLALTFVITEATWSGDWDNGNYHGYHETNGISLNQGSSWGHHNYHHNAPAHHDNHDHQHSSHYVAKTLGAVHTAPLPGHIDSVKSFNVAPAPGSGWDSHHHHHVPAHHDDHDHHHHHASHYVAKTLGAVHTAPLPGHIDSVKSFNVAPAPGSEWNSHHHHHVPAHHDNHDHHHHHASHYVAKTLGAVHTAPLPGHIDSVKSFNVVSAPGTH